MRICLIAFLLLILCSSGSCFAESHANFGVIDVKHILSLSTAANELNSNFTDEHKAFNEKVALRKEEISAMDKALSDQQSILSKEAFEEKVKELNALAEKYTAESTSEMNAIEQKYEKAFSYISDELRLIIQEVSSENDLSVVLNSGSVVYKDDSVLDLTEGAIQKLNNKLPSATFTDE